MTQMVSLAMLHQKQTRAKCISFKAVVPNCFCVLTSCGFKLIFVNSQHRWCDQIFKKVTKSDLLVISDVWCSK